MATSGNVATISKQQINDYLSVVGATLISIDILRSSHEYYVNLKWNDNGGVDVIGNSQGQSQIEIVIRIEESSKAKRQAKFTAIAHVDYQK